MDFPFTKTTTQDPIIDHILSVCTALELCYDPREYRTRKTNSGERHVFFVMIQLGSGGLFQNETLSAPLVVVVVLTMKVRRLLLGQPWLWPPSLAAVSSEYPQSSHCNFAHF